MNLARFTVNGNASTNRGYDTTNGAALSFALEASSTLVRKVEFAVSDATDAEAPLASKSAPELELVGTTTGHRVTAATPATAVTTTAAASGVHSWIVRCIVNDGVNPDGSANPDYVFERMVSIRSAYGRRKIVASEGTQYDERGWADAQNEDVDSQAAGEIPEGAANQLLQNDGSQWQAVDGISTDRLNSGTLGVVRGGTGLASYTSGDILYASGSSALAKRALGTAGQVLMSYSGAPSWQWLSNLYSPSGTNLVTVGGTGAPGTGQAIKFTDDGGYAVRMTNRTGAASVKGTVLKLDDTWRITGETTPGQLSNASFTGSDWDHSDGGKLYLTVTDDDGSSTIVDAFANSARTTHVAQGTVTWGTGGTVTMAAVGGSGVTGTIDVVASAVTDATPVADRGSTRGVMLCSPTTEGAPIAGVMYSDGVADGSDVWVVVEGLALVLVKGLPTYPVPAGAFLFLANGEAASDYGKASWESERKADYFDAHGIGQTISRTTAGSLALTRLTLHGRGPTS